MNKLSNFILAHREKLYDALQEKASWEPREVLKANDTIVIGILSRTVEENLSEARATNSAPAEPTYVVTPENNFCRVFRFCPNIPKGFCGTAGVPVNMVMVDWFNPVPEAQNEVITIGHSFLTERLVPWLSKKVYVRPDMQYVAIFDFGASVVFGEPWTGLRTY